MSSKLTLIFVPGAWHTPDTWGKLTSALEAHQLKCASITLPTTLSDPTVNFSTDVKAVRDSILAETTQGRNVVVVVHSYGGAVGSSAINGLTQRQQDGTSGHVIGLFMIATGFVAPNMTFLDAFDGNPPPIWDLNYETGFVDITVDPRELFYHDLPEDEGNYWVGRLQKQALKALNEGAKDAHSGWKDVPVWYLSTVEDKALPVQAQRVFVQNAKDAGGDVTVREIASSHSPMLSKPAETAAVILEAVEAFTR
ncbi:hypothetical protein AK830_g2355 [Neonectria ditissima]|uniref:AB hydrolase-1 domain-containing protein n=1 Tax=Neonectria ditissima TaxID=78410 RepID=A0A0P7BS42_9HYPO|nr:hypothetical protein AK830_g2355 [Neonectria ditissima]